MRLDGRVGVVAPGYLADVIVVAGDPSADIRLLQDRSRLKAVIARGKEIDLTGPWPTRHPIAGEKVGSWASEILTYERAHSLGRV